MTRLLPILLLALAWLPGLPALAQQHQQTAILIADDVFLSGDDKLTARGNVEAMYGGRRLKAQSVIYDKTTDKLEITGPITIYEGGDTLVLADSGQLDRDMQNGLLRGARLVMRQQLQLAAFEMVRVNGRYSQLYKATVTSCRVCANGKPPLWQIRARRVVHDQQERQLYFDDAQLRVLDTPILYLPRLRLPDPTLERATGFLIPSLYNSTLLGTGVKVPYFIKIGDHKDLTLTPFWTTKSRTLELRYRQAFRRGRIEFNGAVSDDDFGARSRRAYLFGEGRFELKRDFILSFDIEAVNDDTYLIDYSFSDKDRLDSELAVARTRRDEYIRAAITYFRSLRDGESNSTLPTIAGNAEYERRVFPRGSLGGELRFNAGLKSQYRASDLAMDGVDFDPFADGRDVTRLTGGVHWRQSWTAPMGLRATFQAGVDLDHFEISQAGATSRSQATEVTPSTALAFRLPLARTTAAGATDILEPVVQLAWVGGSNPFVPSDESTRVEFDEGNLLSLSRFPSEDRRERGASAAYGLTWTRLDPRGWESSFALGQVVRDETIFEADGLTTSFSNTSGLRSRTSDVLAAGQFQSPDGLVLTARGLFDGAFNTTKAEARAGWYNDRTSLGATYIWLQADLAEDRPGTISEWAFDGSYRLSRYWTGSAQWRYDVASDESVRAGLGIKYTNECVDIELSASRRFTSSTILEPSTDISFTVGLRGFSVRTQDKSYVRTCRK